MNYLAHLHIADQSKSSLLGNLLGDFVKGDPDKQYSVDVAQGIRLHRWVDAYTDRHPLMSRCKSMFPGPTRRFSPIALDMLWDHFLARHWQQFHTVPLTEFVTKAETQVRFHQAQSVVPQRYLSVTEHMWKGRWLESYAELDNIQYALQRMSQRSERMQPLVECFPLFVDHYASLETLFFELYPDVLEKAKTALL